MEHAIQFDSYALIAGAAVNRPLVGRLLRMAEQYQSEGSIRQATEMFWTLAEDYQQRRQGGVAGNGRRL